MTTLFQRIRIEIFKVLHRGKSPQTINQYVTEIPGRRPDIAALQSRLPPALRNLPPPRNPVFIPQQRPMAGIPSGFPAQQIPVKDPATPAEKPEERFHWIWNVPDVIGGQLDWVVSHLPSARRMRQEKRENEEKYQQFLGLAKGK